MVRGGGEVSYFFLGGGLGGWVGHNFKNGNQGYVKAFFYMTKGQGE